MALRPEVSLPVGLATAAVVWAVYQGALPPVVDVRASREGNTDVESTEKMAAWTATAIVAGISLIAKDATVFILGGSMVVALSWWHKHANMVIPEIGKAVPTQWHQEQGTHVNDDQQTDYNEMDNSY